MNSCMGRVRDYKFDAVIGVGGIGSEAQSYGIDRKINWVGINPTRHDSPGKRASEVTFDHFLYLEESGPLLEDLAPNLATRLFHGGARILLDGYSSLELREAIEIVQWAKKQKSIASSRRQTASPARNCESSCPPTIKVRKCGC